MPWLWIGGAAAAALLLLNLRPSTLWRVSFDRGGLGIGQLYARNQAEARTYAAKLKQRGFNVLGIEEVDGAGLSYRLQQDRQKIANL